MKNVVGFSDSSTPEVQNMNRTELTEYLTKEIETLSTNTMTFRSRIAFSVFIGPFLILGSIIVSTSRSGLNLSLDSRSAWIAAVIAGLAFWTLGIISGRIEQGALEKCNQWRRCIIKLQSEEPLTNEELEELILDKPPVRVMWVYLGAFLLILITFASTAYLATELVRASAVDNSKPPISDK